MKTSYVLTWLGLMVFLAVTLGSSYIPMGPWNTAINMAISCAKATLIAIFFMHLRHAPALLRIGSITALVFLTILFGLSWADYATRTISPAAWVAR